MITKQQKKIIVSELVERFKRAEAFYLVDFNTMTVLEAMRLRREFKKNKIEYRVAKNTLIRFAVKEVHGDILPGGKLFGPTGIVFGYDDAIAPVRIIKEQFEKFNKPALKLAVIGDQVFDGSKLKELAALPSKKEIMAGIVGSLNAPVSGIVGAINAVMRDVASLVEEVAKKQAA